MNVKELKSVLDGALQAGLHPDTEVVLAHEGWYVLLEDEVKHPVDGKEGADMWFTLTPHEEEGQYVEADSRFTPGHAFEPDADLHLYYVQSGSELYYTDWLQAEYDDLAGALADDPPRDRAGLADSYRGLAALLRELDRMGA